ncbi:unnamed protein product [Phaeothamnion confervicola]
MVSLHSLKVTVCPFPRTSSVSTRLGTDTSSISILVRPQAATGYDPKRSKINDDKLAEFIRSPITGDITEVPGIADGARTKLAAGEGDDKVTNTYQLIGKFLALKGPDSKDHKVDSVEHCDKFWYWLQSKEVNSHRSGIVNAIAEKVNTWMPGTYDADAFES